MKILLQPDIQDFILEHADRDTAQLALKKPPRKDWPYRLILNQIKARQKIARKIPAWLNIPGMIYPDPDVIEQASSEAASRWKASLVKGHTLVDLTAGAGADLWWMADRFEKAVGVECDSGRAARLRHNVSLKDKAHIDIVQAGAEDFIHQMPVAAWVYIDPQRREGGKRGQFRLSGGRPDILQIIPALKDKTDNVMLKTSPFLDIKAAVQALKWVKQVYVVEWQAICREVLYVLNFANKTPYDDICIEALSLCDEGRVQNRIRFSFEEEYKTQALLNDPQRFIYEPGPAFLKSGAFALLSKRFSCAKLHSDTHLYTSQEYVREFPGRHFELINTYGVHDNLPFKKANLALRNFPVHVSTLKDKLALGDGGEDYVFACKIEENKRVLLHCKKT